MMQATRDAGRRSRPVNVLLVGHSYVRRLGEYMQSTYSAGNLGLDPHEVIVRWVGKGGACLRAGDPQRCFLSVLGASLSPTPDTIYVHIGENDVSHLSCENITSAIMAIMQYIQAACSPFSVICSQLFPFPVFSDYPVDIVMPINASLSASISAHSLMGPGAEGGPTRLDYWKHEIGLWQPQPWQPFTDLFLADRVHLNPVGMQRYWKSESGNSEGSQSVSPTTAMLKDV